VETNSVLKIVVQHRAGEKEAALSLRRVSYDHQVIRVLDTKQKHRHQPTPFFQQTLTLL